MSVTKPLVFALVMCRSKKIEGRARHAINAEQTVRPIRTHQGIAGAADTGMCSMTHVKRKARALSPYLGCGRLIGAFHAA
jgi:hypothetical protein